MFMQRRIRLSTAGLLLAAGCAYAEKGYVIRDLGNFGALSASVDAMNDRGQMLVNTTAVTSDATGSVLVYRAYIVDGSKSTPLPVGTKANGINSYGDVVGSITVNYRETAFLYKNGAFTTLAPLIRANAINDRGQIVGVGPGKNRSDRAVLLQNGTVTELGPFGSGFCCESYDASAAVAINERGRIAATTLIDGSMPGAWYWENGVQQNFDSFVGGPTLTSLNESGTLAGFTNASDECFHWLFVVQNGVFRVLPLPGKAGMAAINDAGTIAGTMSSGMSCGSSNGDVTTGYVLDADGDFTGLPPLARGAYSSARALNNRGQVGGAAFTSSGESHAVFWERR
jgi:probable HAF family extracellular repeat protein